LAQVVCGHNNLGAGLMNMVEQPFDGSGCRRIKTGSWLIEEQHLGLENPGPRQGEALLLPG
jgi:hypothetical protein